MELTGKLGKICNKGYSSCGSQISLSQSSYNFKAVTTSENYTPYFSASNIEEENIGKENLYHTLDLVKNDFKVSLSRSG